jgi:4-hydroxybenzoate polyprenyltransferase
MLAAFGASPRDFAGAIVLHLAFLAYLESRHAHAYRAPVPAWIAYAFAVAGLALFWKFEGVLYVVFSYLYTKKTKDTGYLSPLFRGLQAFVIVAGIVGYTSLALVAGGALLTRNLLGDFRDTEKDRREGVQTLPVLLGFRRSFRHVHLAGTMATSLLWWGMAGSLSAWWLLAVWAAQMASYRLTPR